MIILKSLEAENFKLLRSVRLAFPCQGSVLVEGLNESGKSTLFESVFFALHGAPLVTEGRGKGGMESVIRHGADGASVVLVVEVDQAELEIRRSLKRGRPTQAGLVVRRPGQPDEHCAGVQAVNARVVAELGGLDGEALLNSCFVEQKKLSKVEDLAPAQRKDSLRRLLNLEKLTDLAERLRVTPQDERLLAEARGRLELAELALRLPTMVDERVALEDRLGAVRLPVRRDASGEEIPVAAGQGPEMDLQEDAGWSESAERLAALRRRAGGTRRRGYALGGAGAMALVAAVLLFVGGAGAALGVLLAALVLVGLAAAAFGTARRLDDEVLDLESALASRRDALVGKIGEMEGRCRRLEERLGLDRTTVDPMECRREVARLERQREVRRRAAILVEGAMERIARQVLPNTERNLGQILPLLTAGRYHEARIGEDYQVQVWDDAAGRYVSKGLFSGGARDQFSLALRLAFALATLPQELGAAPGFLFLDEPLSSFDGPRSQALVRLLTEGQVADAFRQIFVISHTRSFDAAAFRYHLVMRDGRVVESDFE